MNRPPVVAMVALIVGAALVIAPIVGPAAASWAGPVGGEAPWSGGGSPVLDAEPSTVSVPDLIGLTEIEALDILVEVGLQPGSRFEISTDDMPAGSVTAQDPRAGTEVPLGTSVDYVVSLGTGGEPNPGLTAEPTLEPASEPSPQPSTEASPLSHWGAFKDRLTAFQEIAYPAIVGLSDALWEGDTELAGSLATEIQQASLDLLAWLDGNLPDPCYLASWEALHRAAELLASAMDTIATLGLDAASAAMMEAGSALGDAAGTIMDSGDACLHPERSVASPGS